MTDSADRETAAIAIGRAVLLPLTFDERVRILRYLADRFNVEWRRS